MSLEPRRAIEALRSGVPNRHAVRLLQSGQPRIERRFTESLVSSDHGNSPVPGFILGGEFGSGKSHILQNLREDALRKNFAVSLVVVSKETPLSDLDLVFKAAIKELMLPDRPGGDLNEAVIRIDLESPEYAAFFRDMSAQPNALGLDQIFAATLKLNEANPNDEELTDYIVSFWAGGRISVAKIKKALRASGEGMFTLKSLKSAEIAEMRFTFGAGLLKASGYAGWVLLLDEVELVAKFPPRGRARAYSNLVRLTGRGQDRIPHLFTVGAATQDFKGVIVEKDDRTKIPLGLATRDPRLAALSRQALDVICDSPDFWETIRPQTDADLDRVYREVLDLYSNAFNWRSSDTIRPPYQAEGRSMRLHMREWITRWDLSRLYPSYRADILSEQLRPDLAEEADLEGFSEPDASDDDEA